MNNTLHSATPKRATCLFLLHASRMRAKLTPALGVLAQYPFLTTGLI